jgi:hypothetical protein
LIFCLQQNSISKAINQQSTSFTPCPDHQIISAKSERPTSSLSGESSTPQPAFTHSHNLE